MGEKDRWRKRGQGPNRERKLTDRGRGLSRKEERLGKKTERRMRGGRASEKRY